jgi:hypothetical protein
MDTNKKYETLLIKNGYFYSDYKAGIEIVKKFIKQKDLILYGGTAIDFALRKKGSLLYDDESALSLPDLDCYSPNSVADAYELAQLLHVQGLTDISAIVAIHVQTMKVRTHTLVVADISYCPENVFKTLPTIEFDGYRVIHPHFQMLTMHLSMCFPFINAPREVILDRKNKDFERYDMLYEKYPFTPGSIIPIKELKRQKITFDIESPDTAVYAGILCYAIIYQLMLEKKVKFAIEEHPYAKLSIKDTTATLEIDWNDLDSLFVSFISIPGDESTNKGIKYCSYMDIIPSSYISLIDKKESKDILKSPGAKKQIIEYNEERFHVSRIDKTLICSTQYSMMLMLFYNEITNNKIYINYYLALMHLNKAAYTHFPLDKIKDISPFIIPMQFWPSVDTPSISNALRISMDTTYNIIHKNPRIDNIRPKSYYPATSAGVPTFNYSESPYFNIDFQPDFQSES